MGECFGCVGAEPPALENFFIFILQKQLNFRPVLIENNALEMKLALQKLD